MRKDHILRHNKASQFPQKILFYDVETKGRKRPDNIIAHSFILASTCYVTKTKFKDYDSTEKNIFMNKKDFWDYTLSKTANKTTLLMIAHNENWDFIAVNGFYELLERGWEMKGAIIEKGIWIVRFTKGDKRIVVYDSINWFRFKLKEMGKVVGLLKTEIDFEKCTCKELSDYCMNDTMILTKFFGKWVNFLREHNFGNFKPTIASQAFSCYTHRFMNYPIHIHTNQKAIDLERESFRGGVNLCFKIGEYIESIYDLDVVSMYASQMKDHYFPTRLIEYSVRPTKEKLISFLKNFAVIAKVKIRMNHPTIALRREKLIFPIGTFIVTLTSPELEYVNVHGEILEVYEAAIYYQEKIFDDYVDYFIDLKLKYAAEKNFAYEKISKMLLNALYGRFGLKIRDKFLIGECSIYEVGNELQYDARTKELTKVVRFGGKVFQYDKDHREGNDSFPAIPSFVSAHARMKLWEIIYLAELPNMFYCDTDSVFLNKKGYKKVAHLIDPEKMGMLKIEDQGQRLKVFGCKDYELDDVVKIKGIKESAIKLGEGLYKQERFLKIKSLMKKGQLDTPQIEIITKQLKRIYDKGHVLPNGQIIPFKLTE